MRSCRLFDALAMKDDQNVFGKALNRLRATNPLERVSLAAVCLAIFDIFIKSISITALGLLVLAALPWLIQLFHSMELPGGLKFEFRDLEKIKESAESAGLLKRPEPKQAQPYEAVFPDDPNLALAGLRMELEKRLRRLGESAGINLRPASIGRLIPALRDAGVLDEREVSVISDLLPLLNKAVHAENLDERASFWAMDVGPQLLSALDDKISKFP